MTNAKTSTEQPANQSPAHALWRIVASEHEQASAQFERNWAEYEAAENAAQAEYPPRLRELQDTIGLRVHMTREEATDAVDRFIAVRDRFPGRHFTVEESVALAAKSNGIVDEFFGLVRVYEQIWDKHRVNQLRAANQSFGSEVYEPAREKLLTTPAPDFSALLYKAGVLAVMFDDAEGLAADLRRLLAEGK